MFPLRFFLIWFLFIFIFLLFNQPRVQNSIFAGLKILRGENESFICVNECKKSGLIFLEYIYSWESVVRSFVFPLLICCSKVSQIDSRTNPLGEVENDMNQETSILQYTSIQMWRKYCWNYQKIFQFMSIDEEWSFML